MLVASGGEQRISGTLDRLAESPLAALLLGAVAVGQITSQDAGVTRQQVGKDLADALIVLEGLAGDLNPAAFDQALDAAQAERLVRDSNGRLRTPHVRVADRAMLDLARRRDDTVGPGVRAIIRSQLRRADLPIRGKYWMLDSLTRSDVLRHPLRQSWLDDETVSALVNQCLGSASGAERSAAAHVLGDLDFARVLNRGQWESITDRAIVWLPSLDSTEVFGFARLMMHLRGSHADLRETVRRSLAPTDMAVILSTRGSRRSAEAWADLLRELAPPYNHAGRDAWESEFNAGLDYEALRAWLADTGAESHNQEIYQLIDVLAGLLPAAASTALDASATHMRVSFETDLGDATSGIARWVFGTMALVAHLTPATEGGRELDLACRLNRDGFDVPDAVDGQPWKPPPALVDFANKTLKVMQQVDWALAGASLEGRRLYQVESLDMFLVWLGWLSTDLLDDLADSIPFVWLDQLARDDPDDGSASPEAAGRAGSDSFQRSPASRRLQASSLAWPVAVAVTRLSARTSKVTASLFRGSRSG